jgi:prophage maintenance system killer protein
MLCCHHPFNDGNKRAAHAAMEAVLLMNGYALTGVDGLGAHNARPGGW